MCAKSCCKNLFVCYIKTTMGCPLAGGRIKPLYEQLDHGTGVVVHSPGLELILPTASNCRTINWLVTRIFKQRNLNKDICSLFGFKCRRNVHIINVINCLPITYKVYRFPKLPKPTKGSLALNWIRSHCFWRWRRVS